MAVVAKFWLVIESAIIPDGFLLKWFRLSFFIHPFFLVICQIFLWLRLILKSIFTVLLFAYKIVYFPCVYFFKFFKYCVVCVFSLITRLTSTFFPSRATEKVEGLEIVQFCNHNQTFSTSYGYSFSCITPKPSSCQLKVLQFQKSLGFEDEKYEVIIKDGKVSCDNIKDMEEEEEEESLYFDGDEDEDEDDSSSICSSSCGSSSEESSALSTTSVDSDSINSRQVENIDMVNDHNEPIITSFVFSFNSSAAEDRDSNKYSPSVVGLDSVALVEQEETYEKNNSNIGGCFQDGDLDEFYNKYAERMRWFDILNYDRTCGRSALNMQIGTPSSTDSTTTTEAEAVDSSVFPYIIWEKTARKKLLRSLETDFELVYVSQACLCWEALHHQYRKVEALSSATFHNGVFYDNVAGEFQKFQVLLERFMEDERCEGKRVWNYVRGRFSFKSLIQVPKVSGFFEHEMEEMKTEAINVKEVLKAIEKCIDAFWVFVKTDDKRPWWKFRSSLWTSSPVEDPRDLTLLADLTRQLQKKEMWLKDSQGKQRCWVKKVVNIPVNESQKKEMIFTMIDLKLVSRVLQLPALSSAQLKWCQQKLDKIEFHEGKIARASTSGPLFPP